MEAVAQALSIVTKVTKTVKVFSVLKERIKNFKNCLKMIYTVSWFIYYLGQNSQLNKHFEM